MANKGGSHIREQEEISDSLAVYVRMHSSGKDVLMAACDEELIGKELRDGELRLYVNPAFYKGELVNEEIFKNMAISATIGNLVGKRCVEFAIKIGIVHKDFVLKIDGVPHAQFVRL